MSANVMAELGHADLIDPDEIEGPDESVDADLAWGPGIVPLAAGPSGSAPEVVGISAADEALEFFARQRASRAAQEASAARRRTLRPPAPEIPATALTRPQVTERGATAAGQLMDAALAAGWTVTATYARGPYVTERTFCPACLTWQKVNKAGGIGVHGPKADRCRNAVVDPTSPSFQVVDSIVVRATSPARPDGGVHRLVASWIDDGDDPGRAQYSLVSARLWYAGDRPRDVDVVAVRSALKAIGAGRKSAKVARKRGAAK